MAVLYGDVAFVNGESTVFNWDISTKAEVKEYVASNTKKGTGRLPGNKDWTGNFECGTSEPATMPGDALTLEASIDGVKGVSGDAVAESLEVTCDILGGGPVTCKVAFGSAGVLTRGASTVTDATDPNPDNASDGFASLGTVADTPVYTPLTECTKWNLKITAKVGKHVSSSTSKNTIRSSVAKVIDCTASVSFYFADPATMPVEGDIIALKLFVSATAAWEIRWMIIDSISDIKVDPKTDTPVGCTLNLSWTGYTNIADTPTEGLIKTPGETTYWPASA